MDHITLYYTKCSNAPSHSMLVKSASFYSGIPQECFEISAEYGKKPYFSSHPNIHFSVSHSGEIWAAAFSCKEVGLDIQIPNCSINHEKIAKRYFHPDEYKKYIDGENFYSIWTRKEAVCKLFGFGIDGRFSKINTYANSFDSIPFSVKTVSPNSSSTLYYSIAFNSDFEYNIIEFN